MTSLRVILSRGGARLPPPPAATGQSEARGAPASLPRRRSDSERSSLSPEWFPALARVEADHVVSLRYEVPCEERTHPAGRAEHRDSQGNLFANPLIPSTITSFGDPREILKHREYLPNPAPGMTLTPSSSSSLSAKVDASKLSSLD